MGFVMINDFVGFCTEIAFEIKFYYYFSFINSNDKGHWFQN